MSGEGNPWKQMVKARDELSSAGNYCSDAIGEVMAEEPTVSSQQADERRVRIERRIRGAEVCLKRARRALGIPIEEGDDD